KLGDDRPQEPGGGPANEPKETGITASAPAATAVKSTGIKKGSKQKQQQHQPRKEVVAAAPIVHEPRAGVMTGFRRFRWVMLGAVPSSLMLGVTNVISTDLSPIPLLWVIPLSLYLLSFILVFLRWPVPWTGQPHTFMLMLQPIVLGFMIFSVLI